MEVYSQERIAKEAKKFGLEFGVSMDLLNGYNFDSAEDRKRGEARQAKEKPALLVRSPMCTMFSVLQNLSEWNDKKEKKLGVGG